jgi:hypothetical protein
VNYIINIIPFLPAPKLRDKKGRYISSPNLDSTVLPSKILDCLIGNLLGDGNLNFNHKGADGKAKPNTNALYAMTLKSQEYITHLAQIYEPICTSIKIRPWPNPKTGKKATQYTFSTRSLPQLTKIHSQ